MNNKEILITGGTGTLGKALVLKLKTEYQTKGIRIFSRDEFKQYEFKKYLSEYNLEKNVSFLIGDVADKDRVRRAMRGVDICIHTAAMKHVDSCEENPLEAVRINIEGAINVVLAAFENNVDKVMNISTDKAVHPVNLYGMTKGVAEKIFINANIYAKTKYSCCRYGNVIGSRGSVIPKFKKQLNENGYITLTDSRMTRFWIPLVNVVDFVIDNIKKMQGSEIFIPIMKSLEMKKLIESFFPNAAIKNIGARPGEKLHEMIISDEEFSYTKRLDDRYIVNPHEMSGYCEIGVNCTSLNSETWDIKDLKEYIDV